MTRLTNYLVALDLQEREDKTLEIVWLAPGDGELPKTTVRSDARRFASFELANAECQKIRAFQNFPCATVIPEEW